MTNKLSEEIEKRFDRLYRFPPSEGFGAFMNEVKQFLADEIKQAEIRVAKHIRKDMAARVGYQDHHEYLDYLAEILDGIHPVEHKDTNVPKSTNKELVSSELREKILKEIDFLSDHWVKGDDRPPFTFGGWREEVADSLVDILKQAIKQERERWSHRI